MDAIPTASRIHALVGPTNTGKTHRAIERMLEHASGMIGLPLRLLAREVYDKVSARVGEDAVALVTGEEQRIPKRPAYWIATVEAMPVERPVDFVAVDEVQLAAHDQRGHVFTSRILNARGRHETWFLGAGTMRRILPQLVPTVQMEEHPRLSSLTFAGQSSLSKLPRRSAVVAFSMPHVYEIAERLRTKKGGAAVVLGGLSPRTRNAQVAMFQAGEVDYLVATDAVGMGLNLGVSHVAFASLRKFDGREARFVDEAELGQIAGRAGRWIENGTFGTLAPQELPPGIARAVEMHEFSFVKKVKWRNDQLDFSSVEALEASLQLPSPRPILSLVHTGESDDSRALALMLRNDEVRRVARGAENVRLLWDVCSVPDFRKLLFEAHVAFLRELYLELVARGRLDDAWIAPRVADLSVAGGDVETLVAQIASTRVWTYVATRSAWLRSPERWQEETRAREDSLSDALHARLVLRFVDASGKRRGIVSRARPSSRSLDRTKDQMDAGPLAVAAHHPFAKLAALRSQLSSSRALLPGSASSSSSMSALDALALRSVEEQAEVLIEAPSDALLLEDDGTIVHRPTARVVGALVRGPQIARPDVQVVAQVVPEDAEEAESDARATGMAHAEMFPPGARLRIHRRLLAFVRDVASSLVGGEATRGFMSREAHPAARGLFHRLEQQLGTAWASEVDDAVRELPAVDRAALEEAGIVLGGALVYAKAGLTSEALRARLAMARVWYPNGQMIQRPRAAVSFVSPAGVRLDGGRDLAIGFPRVDGRSIRADVIEKVDARRRADLCAGNAIEHETISRWIGVPLREVPGLLAALARIARVDAPDISPGRAIV